MIKQTFQQIQTDNDLKEIIHSAFDIELQVSGGWGYNQEDALIIHELSVPLKQLQHTLASMRSHLEMNMTLPKEKRYGAINLNEINREELKKGIRKYDIITFQISGMLEETYAELINEYKEGQERKDFDLNDHFKRRKEHTLLREELFWFDVTELAS